MAVYCLDSNVIIVALNERMPSVSERFDAEVAAGARLILPTIVLFELEFAVAGSARPEKNARVLDKFVEAAGLELVDFDADDAREAGGIRAHLKRAGTPIGPYDLLIAAQARRRGAAVVTANVDEFARVPGLTVENWGG